MIKKNGKGEENRQAGSQADWESVAGREVEIACAARSIFIVGATFSRSKEAFQKGSELLFGKCLVLGIRTGLQQRSGRPLSTSLLKDTNTHSFLRPPSFPMETPLFNLQTLA